METVQSIVPTLQVISGPLSGRLFKIDRDVLIIGRNPDCDVILEPMSVSRRHAAIVRRNNEHVIRDLGSTRGTHLNGHKLTQPTILQSGHVIKVGEVQLEYTAQAVQIYEGSQDQSTVFAAIDVAGSSDQIQHKVKPEQKLLALQQITLAFGSTLILSEILEKVLATLFEIFPRAERGFVLLEDRERHILAPEAIRTRSEPAGDLSISKSILQRVLNEGQAILSKDLAAEFPNVDSISDGRIRSLMCVPILGQDKRPLGIIQIDTKDGRGRFEQEDLDLLVSVATQISVAVQNAQLHEALMRQHEMEQELVLARQVMQALLPERPLNVAGYEFWDYYEPARHLGGDYYGFLPLFDPQDERRDHTDHWAIAVGDVVGKGLPAALVTAKLSTEIRLFLQGENDPSKVVTRLNRLLSENGVLDMYITFVLSILDVGTNRLQVANAGHPAPLIRRRDGRIEELGRDASGLPLAIEAGWNYEPVETTIEPGDLVVLYTDGVTDAHSTANERFGDKRIYQALEKAPAGAAAAGDFIIQQVRRHAIGKTQFDDITLVVFGRT